MMELKEINEITMNAIKLNNEQIADLKKQITALERHNGQLMNSLMEFIEKTK